MKLSEWRAASPLPLQETDMLIESVCGADKIHILSDAAVTELSAQAALSLDALCQKRLAGVPLQYLLGYAYFMGLKFMVSPHVLIPRPDTEILVWETAQWLRAQHRPAGLRVLDLCTGSGCVGIGILQEVGPGQICDLTMSDISEEALEVAKKNFSRLLYFPGNKKPAVQFVQSDYFHALQEQTFDLIVSNPPYIRKAVIGNLASEVKDYEPRIALDGGEDGLDAYRLIAAQAPGVLSKGGHIFLEIGYDQAEGAAAIFRPVFQNFELFKDFSGHARVIHVYN